MIDSAELKRAIEKADLLIRPYAICCNPKYQKEIEDNFGKQFVVYASDVVPPEEVYLVQRKEFDALIKGGYE